MEYCCHVWAGAPVCYLDMLDKLQHQVYRTVGLTFTSSLQPLGHHRNIASSSLYLKWLNWFCFLIVVGGLPFILIYCIIFLSKFLHVMRSAMPTVSFLTQLDSGNFLLAECFPLTYDLNSFTSRINRHILFLCSFYLFLFLFNLFLLYFLVTPCFVAALQPCME